MMVLVSANITIFCLRLKEDGVTHTKDHIKDYTKPEEVDYESHEVVCSNKQTHTDLGGSNRRELQEKCITNPNSYKDVTPSASFVL